MAEKLARIENGLSDVMYARWMLIKCLIVEAGELDFEQVRRLWSVRAEVANEYLARMRRKGLPIPYGRMDRKGVYGMCPKCEIRLQVWVDAQDQIWRFCEMCMYEEIER